MYFRPRLLRTFRGGIFALLAIGLASATGRAETINIFLIGGQSNADGRARTSGLPSNLQTPQANVPFYYSTSVGLTTLRPGTSANSDGISDFGPEITFGKSLATYYNGSGQTVALLKYALGGTSLTTDWKAGGDATTTNDGPVYQTFQNTINAGLLALQNAHPGATLVINGMIWVQGESDIDIGAAAVSSYAANLTQLITDLRTTYNVPDLPFLLSRVSSKQTVYSATSDPDYQNYLTLRSQQASVAANVPNAYLIDTDGANFTTNNPSSGTGLHYDATGEQALGNAFAARMQALLAAPEPTSAALLLSGLLALGMRRRARR